MTGNLIGHHAIDEQSRGQDLHLELALWQHKEIWPYIYVSWLSALGDVTVYEVSVCFHHFKHLLEP